jgi:hypothetical protein
VHRSKKRPLMSELVDGVDLHSQAGSFLPPRCLARPRRFSDGNSNLCRSRYSRCVSPSRSHSGASRPHQFGGRLNGQRATWRATIRSPYSRQSFSTRRRRHMQDGKVVRLREPVYQIGATARGIADPRRLPTAGKMCARRPTHRWAAVSLASAAGSGFRSAQGPKQRLAKWRS